MPWLPNKLVYINGDGETSCDFCYIEYRLLAVACDEAANQIYNMAGGDRTTLNDLFELIKVWLTNEYPHLENFKPIYQDFIQGMSGSHLLLFLKLKTTWVIAIGTVLAHALMRRWTHMLKILLVDSALLMSGEREFNPTFLRIQLDRLYFINYI